MTGNCCSVKLIHGVYLCNHCAELVYSNRRRDSNILLPKTPSMKRKRRKSESDQSSDDNAIHADNGVKAPKTQIQGYASPLVVINEGELLDSGVVNEENREKGSKRTTRAQGKRQQPKRGARKKNVSVIETPDEEPPDSPSVPELPKRSTRNSRKKNSEINEENKLPKRFTRNTLKKIIDGAAQVSSTEDLPVQPVTKKRRSSVRPEKAENSGDVPVVPLKKEPVSPAEEVQALRRSLLNSTKVEENETENVPIPHVPETPDQSVNCATENVASPAANKIHRAAVHLILQSPRLGIGRDEGVTVGATAASSPCIKEENELYHARMEETAKSANQEKADCDVASVSSSTPKFVPPDKSPEKCKFKLKETEIEEDVDSEGKLDKVQNVAVSATKCDETDTNKDVNKEDMCPQVVMSDVESSRRSMRRSSGWRRRSKRLNHQLSPANRRLSIKKTVTKSKTPSRKSLVKSSVKLKLMSSKLMPELRLTGTKQSRNDQVTAQDKDMEDVRVRLFDDWTSHSSDSANSATCHSSCSSSEDKGDPPAVEKLFNEIVEDDVEEVFHDCLTENEGEQLAKEEPGAKTDRYLQCTCMIDKQRIYTWPQRQTKFLFEC